MANSDKVRCSCGKIFEVSSFATHIRTSRQHGNPTYVNGRLTYSMTFDQMKDLAKRQLATQLIPDEQLKIGDQLVKKRQRRKGWKYVCEHRTPSRGDHLLEDLSNPLPADADVELCVECAALHEIAEAMQFPNAR